MHPSPPSRRELTTVQQPFADVACGERHTIAVTKELPGTLLLEPEVYAWGDGSNGRLGLGDETDALTPRRVVGFQPNLLISHKVRLCCT